MTEVAVCADANEIATELLFLNMGQSINRLAKSNPQVKAMKDKMEAIFRCRWRGGIHYKTLKINGSELEMTDACYRDNLPNLIFRGQIVGVINSDGEFKSDAKTQKMLEKSAFGTMDFRNLETSKDFASGEEEFAFKAALMTEHNVVIFGIAPEDGEPVEEILVATDAF